MARDDSWAQVLRVALPLLDGARPSGMLGWVRPCRPGCDPGRRRGRALGRRAPAAGPGRVDERCWLRAGGVGPGHGSADPGRGATEHGNRTSSGCKGRAVLREPGTKAPAAARTPTPAARRLERHLSRSAPFFKATDTPQYKLASTVVGMVLGVWWGLRHPRRLTVLAIASESYTVVFYVPWVARAVQRRRPRIAAGWALVVAGSVARLRAAAAEPLR